MGVNTAVGMDIFRSKRIGSKKGRAGAGSDAEFASQCEAVARDFDAEFYQHRYPDVDGELLVHFMAYGWRELRESRPLVFDQLLRRDPC